MLSFCDKLQDEDSLHVQKKEHQVCLLGADSAVIIKSSKYQFIPQYLENSFVTGVFMSFV
jgi:hypothetical protein